MIQFDINSKIEVNQFTIDNSLVYVVDNFYKNPYEILNFFISTKPPIHKSKDNPSFNQIYFDDRRHILKSINVSLVYRIIYEICGKIPEISHELITTNFTRFFNSDFNNYFDNYWWPHKDTGYNGIVYLNQDDSECGTNLYENINPKEELPNGSEHFAPWRPKKNYKLIKSLEPKFNRLVLFDGNKFFHGMNICNRRYFGETYRMNQVFFLK